MAEPRLRASLESRSSVSVEPAIQPPAYDVVDAASVKSKRSVISRFLGDTRPWRRLVGLLLLLTTVFLWTASNFLASTIFADDSYSKPYFVTYVNSATFLIPLIPVLAREVYRKPTEARAWPKEFIAAFRRRSADAPVDGTPYIIDSPDVEESQELLLDDSQQLPRHTKDYDAPLSTLRGKIPVPETARLALEFCLLWFAANYFAAACLEYTTVASATILTSTSSVFTLMFGTLFGVERFTVRKLLGILASLAGIIMVSSIDLSGSSNDEEHRGDFPEKDVKEIAIGNAMAFASAVFYGVYAVFMKARLQDETRVNMPIFFGMVGVFNIVLMWPGFLLLHITGVEQFELPPSGFIWLIVICNSIASLVADLAWAFAVLLTSPIVVTVGLSMTIPLSLVGEMVLNNQTATVLYWVGAGIVVLSFLFVNHEETVDGSEDLARPASVASAHTS